MQYKTKPMQHQFDAYNLSYRKEYFAYFMEQGTGKSKTVIDVCCNLYLDKEIDAVLVIAPNGVQEQWALEQIPEHSSVNSAIKIWNNKSSLVHRRIIDEFINEPKYGKLKWLCVHVDVFSSANYLREFQEYLLNNDVAVIIDESTRIKNHKAQRTYNICYRLARLKKQGKRILEVQPLAKYRFILTGTMITNSPYDLWSMFEFLKHNYFECNYYAFKAHYGIEVKDVHPGTGRLYHRKITKKEIQSVLKYSKENKHPAEIAYIMGTSESSVQYIISNPGIQTSYKNLDKLKEQIKEYSYIVKKEECLDLPPKIYEKLYVEMNAEQKRIYKELRDQLLTEYMDKELTVLNKVSLIGRLQQVTGGFYPYRDENNKAKLIPIGTSNPKINELKRDLEETNNYEVIIIWARFTAELNMLFNELGKTYPERNVALYYGKTDKAERKNIIEEFKKGNVQILIANPATAGIGLNLQRSSFHYFYSNSYSLEVREQAEDRSHRLGIKKAVLYKDIIVKNTVDEKVHAVLKEKKNLLEYFRDKNLEDFLG